MRAAPIPGGARTVLALALAIGAAGSSPGVRAQPPDLDPHVERIVAAVSQDRLVAILKRLESFGSRHTLSSVDSPTRGIGAARQWIFDEMKGYSPKLQVSFNVYRVAKQGRITRDVELRNVMAVLPGTSARRVYVSGHYDTVASAGGSALSPTHNPSTGEILFADPDSPAPGVNDDGSGTAECTD